MQALWLPPEQMTLPLGLPDLPFHLRIDGLAGFFLLLLGSVSAGITLYAAGFFREETAARLTLITLQYHVFLASMAMVLLADDAYLFMVAWETMALSSYFLVTTDHRLPAIRSAGFLYLLIAHLGAIAILLCFGVMHGGHGDYTFSALRTAELTPVWASVAFLLAFFGFGAKAGMIPLHAWLPEAHPAAPSPVSALMSGIMIKTAIYGMVRVYFDFLGGQFPWWWGFVVLTVGAVSALLGVMYALMEHDLKRLLAYHSVENIGIILMGIGAGMIFQSYGLTQLAALGLLAGLYHTINHAMFKALLFLGAGSLLYATHTRNMEEYGGLIRNMPWTAFFFLVGAVSISALPPSNGFVSEWLTFQSLFLSFQIPDLLMKMILPIGAAMLALTGVLALACFAKAFGISFLAMPRSTHARHAREVPAAMRIGMAVLAVACVLLGVAPMVVVPAIDLVTAPLVAVSIADKVLAKGGLALTPMGVGFASISTPVLWICLVLLVPLTLLMAVVIGGKLRTRFYKTWGCGITLKPRMEYTATGFAQPIKQVFSTIYRPTVKLEKDLLEESQYFAKRMHFETHIEPVFEKYLYDPIVRGLNAVADRLRIVQAGNLQLYLTYIFVTLLILLLWVR